MNLFKNKLFEEHFIRNFTLGVGAGEGTLSFDDLSFYNPIVLTDDPDGFNTKITVVVKGMGGVHHVKYNRIDLGGHTGAKFDVGMSKRSDLTFTRRELLGEYLRCSGFYGVDSINIDEHFADVDNAYTLSKQTATTLQSTVTSNWLFVTGTFTASFVPTERVDLEVAITEDYVAPWYVDGEGSTLDIAKVMTLPDPVGEIQNLTLSADGKGIWECVMRYMDCTPIAVTLGRGGDCNAAELLATKEIILEGGQRIHEVLSHGSYSTTTTNLDTATLALNNTSYQYGLGCAHTGRASFTYRTGHAGAPISCASLAEYMNCDTIFSIAHGAPICTMYYNK